MPKCYLQQSKVSYHVSTMKILPTDYSVYLFHTGRGDHQLFIKNMSADADFIRVMVGCTELVHGKRVGQILDQWIITPLQSHNEPVHIGNMNRSSYKSKRAWVVFEAVRRGKKNETVGAFFALSPRPSAWRTKIGGLTYFDIKEETIAPNIRLKNHWQNLVY